MGLLDQSGRWHHVNGNGRKDGTPDNVSFPLNELFILDLNYNWCVRVEVAWNFRQKMSQSGRTWMIRISNGDTERLQITLSLIRNS